MVVVGGSTGAVSAAVAAAEQGAKVFLAAPRPYLGDDMTATLRLWLEEGEKPTTPLARAIFSDPVELRVGPDPNGLPFTYTADRQSAAVHRDTDPPGKLADREWGVASSQSVQYEGDVSIIADLGKPQEIAEVRLIVYYRRLGFEVDGFTVSTSNDKQSWQQAAVVKNKSTEAWDALSAAVPATARYVKLDVKQAGDVERMLLGEIEIVKPAPEVKAPREFTTPRPMHVKKTLDDALLAAGVEFLYGCYPTDVLRDEGGNPCGIVMANRAGRQAVVAKVVIDATDRATVARLAGARFKPYPAGEHTFKRVVIGGEVVQRENMTARVIAPPFLGRSANQAATRQRGFQVIEYTLKLPMAGDSPAAWAKADQLARSMTYHDQQQFTSDALFEVPPDPMRAEPTVVGLSGGVRPDPMRSFQPAGVANVYVLGAAAVGHAKLAESLLRPVMLMTIGDQIGEAAALKAAKLPAPKGVYVPGAFVVPPSGGKNRLKPELRTTGDVREFLTGVRPVQELPTVPQKARTLPVFGEYDVVIIGGGTGGAPAGIGAARAGAKTLVVEYLYGLGGVGTTGAISNYYWGNRIGFSATVGGGNRWVPEQKMEWWRSQLLEAGADIWFGTMGCGAFVEDGHVKGAVVVTPQGRGVVLAKVVIDSTGNTDIAAAAGALTYYTDQTELAMQGTGLPPRQLGATYTNTDFTIADETDVVDIWHLFVYSKSKYAEAFDQGKLVDTRERRRIVGEFTMTILDQVLERTYPDTIEVAYSNFDTHGYTIDPYLELEHPGKGGFYVNMPYRCLLPKGLTGILVTGLGVSAHRDAVPLIRMQADIQNQGYAAGVAAAMAAQAGVPLRQIDLRTLQKHLIEIGNIPERVLTDKDSFPLPPERIAEAVQSVKEEYHGAAVLLAHPREALPLLRKAYAAAESDADKLVYAHVLATLGDASGLDTLLDKVRSATEWDEGWNYRGMGQFGRALSPLDQIIVALGRAGDPRAVPAVLEKLAMLTADTEFSHHRAVGLALELLGDKRAAKPLAGLLTTPGIAGYVHHTVEEARRRDQESPGGTTAEKTRRDSLRELLLARALYRSGDYGKVGEQVLRDYTQDLRGHFSRHAKAVLESKAVLKSVE